MFCLVARESWKERKMWEIVWEEINRWEIDDECDSSKELFGIREREGK